MVHRWLTIGVVITLALGVGVIALNYEKSVQTQRIGSSVPLISSKQSFDDSGNSETEDQQVASKKRFESQSERIEAQMLSELERLNQDIADEKMRLDQDTAEEQSVEESPELVLARVGVILSALESEGIILNYDPTLLTPTTSSPKIQAIKQQVLDIETDLIDIEKKFNNLGNNEES